MPTYTLASEATLALLTEVRAQYHSRLDEHDVKIGVLMAFATTDENTGERKGSAIRGYAGAPAGAQVKKVPTKDRLTKGYDVEMLIDGDEWPNMAETHRRALLDHELTHIETTGKVDDLGRPKLKMRPEDFIAWGFWEIIQRHGKAAMEHRALTILAEKHGQLLLGLDPTEEKKRPGVESIEVDMPKDFSVTFTPETLRKVGEVGKVLRQHGATMAADAVDEGLSSTGRQINEHLSKKRGSKTP